MFDNRQPPTNIEAEQATLGGCLFDQKILAKVSEILVAKDFYHDNHQKLFELLLRFHDENKPYDALIIADELKKQGELEKIGGYDYLTSLYDITPIAGNTEYYAQRVKEKAKRRNLIHAGSLIANLGFCEEKPIEDDLEKAEELLRLIVNHRQTNRDIEMKDLISQTTDDFCDIIHGKKSLTYYPTGIPIFDSIYRGFIPANLIIIAARPGCGKSSLLLQAAIHNAIKIPVLFFSLEMSKEEVGFRTLGIESEINISRSLYSVLPEKEIKTLGESANAAMNRLYNHKFILNDTAAISIQQIRAISRRWGYRNKRGIIFVDYLQLITGGEGNNRDQVIGSITRQLKALAKELNAAVVCASQLTRDTERQKNKRPGLINLRESGNIEQDADDVIFIYCPATDRKAEEGGDETKKKTISDELIIAKRRNNPCGWCKIDFVKKHTKFKVWKDKEINGQDHN